MRLTALLVALVAALAAARLVAGGGVLVVPTYADITHTDHMPGKTDFILMYGIGGMVSEDNTITVVEGFNAPDLSGVTAQQPKLYLLAHGAPGGKALNQVNQLSPQEALPENIPASFDADGVEVTGTMLAKQVWAGLGKPAPAQQFNGLQVFAYFCYAGRGSDVNQKLITDFQQEFQKVWKKSFTIKGNRGPGILSRAKHLPFKTEVVKPMSTVAASDLQDKLMAKHAAKLAAAATKIKAGQRTISARGLGAYADTDIQAFYTEFLAELRKVNALEPDQKKAIQTKKAADRS